MKGEKCFKYKKLFIILALLFVPLFIVSNVSNVSALTSDYWSFKLRLRYGNDSEFSMSEPLHYSNMLTNVQYVNGIRAEVVDIGAVPSGTSFISISGKFNLVAQCYADRVSSTIEHATKCPSIVGDSPSIYASAINGVATSYTSNLVNVYVTDWVIYDPDYNSYIHNRTFTFEYSYIVTDNIPASITSLAFFINMPGAMMGTSPNDRYIYYFEQDSRNLMSVDYTKTQTEALLQQQIQLQRLLNTTIVDQYNQDQQDRDELQDTSDNAQDGADAAASNINNAKTSLLTVIGNFINVVINPPASNCVIDADMGNMDLGDIDLCQLSLPPAFAVIGSLLIIGFIIPFAYSLIMTVLSLLKGATDN